MARRKSYGKYLLTDRQFIAPHVAFRCRAQRRIHQNRLDKCDRTRVKSYTRKWTGPHKRKAKQNKNKRFTNDRSRQSTFHFLVRCQWCLCVNCNILFPFYLHMFFSHLVSISFNRFWPFFFVVSLKWKSMWSVFRSYLSAIVRERENPLISK